MTDQAPSLKELIMKSIRSVHAAPRVHSPSTPARNIDPELQVDAAKAALDETREFIRVRAYEIYQTRVRDQAVGDATSDWLQAERDLMEIKAARTTRDENDAQTQARGEKLMSGGD